MKQEGFHCYYTDQFAKRRQRKILHIDAIDLDRPAFNVVEAREQRGNHCLSRTALANEGRQLSGFDGERNVFQDQAWFLLRRGELRMAEHLLASIAPTNPYQCV